MTGWQLPMRRPDWRLVMVMFLPPIFMAMAPSKPCERIVYFAEPMAAFPPGQMNVEGQDAAILMNIGGGTVGERIVVA